MKRFSSNEGFGAGSPGRWLLVLLALFLAAGCVSSEPKKKVEIFWPEPPVQPRYSYVDYYGNEQDLKGVKSGLDTLLGAREEKVFEKPYGVAVTPDGSRIFVADYGAVHVMDLKEQKLSRFSENLSWPFGLASTPSGKLYVTDMGSHRVGVFDWKGKFLHWIGSAEAFERPSGVAVDEERNRVYVVDTRKHTVKLFDLDGKYISEIGNGHTSEEGGFHFPSNVAVGSDGRVYVVDSGNFRVNVFGPDGEFLNSWGEIGDTPGTFARPKGITIDSDDHIYIADAAFNNIQVFRKDGQLLLWFSGGGEKPGKLTLPATLAHDDQDRIYVVEQAIPRVQVFQYLSEKFFSMFPERQQLLEEKLGVTFTFGEPATLEVPKEPKPPARKTVEPVDSQPGEAEAAASEGPKESVSKPSGTTEMDLLIQVLELRFGEVPEAERARIHSADSEMIRRWGTKVLGAETIRDVFSE